MEYLPVLEYLRLTALFFIQNLVFTTVSRVRNRDNLWWGWFASLGSNGVWIFVFMELVKNFDDPIVIGLYILWTANGSTFGQWANMKVEKWLGSKT